MARPAIPPVMVPAVEALLALMAVANEASRADCIRDDPCDARVWVAHVPRENMASKLCSMATRARAIIDRIAAMVEPPASGEHTIEIPAVIEPAVQTLVALHDLACQVSWSDLAGSVPLSVMVKRESPQTLARKLCEIGVSARTVLATLR